MAGITFEQVVGVIESLTIHGKRVTAANIRAELGRGSMSTILKHLQVWRTTQGKTKPELPDTQDRDYSALHKAVNDLIREATVQVEHEAIRAANDNAETIKGLMAEAEEAKERLQELEEQVAQLTEERGELQAQKKGLETELASAKDELRELRQRNERLIEECATAKAQAEAADQRANAAETRAEKAMDDLRALIQRGSEDTPEPETPPKSKAEAETLRQLVPNQDGMEPRATEPEAEPEPETKAAAPSKPKAKRPPTAQEQKLLDKYGAEAKAKLAENAKEE